MDIKILPVHFLTNQCFLSVSLDIWGWVFFFFDLTFNSRAYTHLFHWKEEAEQAISLVIHICASCWASGPFSLVSSLTPRPSPS